MNRFKQWLRNWLFGTAPVVEAASPRKPMAIRNGVLEEYKQPTPYRDPQDAFRRAQPMPGVLPESLPPAAKLAMDSIDSAVNLPTDYNPLIWFGQGDDDLAWLGYPILAMLAQRSEYRAIIDTYAREMTREWIELTTTGDDDKSEYLTELAELFEKKYGARDLARQLIRVDGNFGRAHLNVRVKGDNDKERTIPLIRKPEKIGKDDLEGFTVIEPLWTYPASYNASEPLAFDFYRPQSWYVLGKEVHGSRLLTVVSRPVPDLLKPAYSFGGLSLIQIARPYVDNWLRSRQSGSDVLHNFSVMVLKTNMATVLEGGGSDMMDKRAQLFNQTRDNRGVMIADKDGEDLVNIAVPLANVDKLVAQAQEQTASVVGMPLIVLLGIAPSGLNSTADGELEVWAQRVAAEQEAVLRPTLQTMLELVQLSEFGKVDETVSFTFRPLRDMSALDEATIRKLDTDGAVAMVGAGILSPEDERTRLAHAKNSIYNGIDLSEPDLPELPDDTSDPAMDAAWNESDHPRDNDGKFGAGGGGSSKAESQKKTIPATKFNAAAYAATHDDKAVTAHSILSHFPPDTESKIDKTLKRLRDVVPTSVKHRDSNGNYTAERAQVHDDIINHILSDHVIAKATPKNGEAPKFIILGGRGGSGKSWFKDNLPGANEAVYLDSDEIKKMLPEFEGWNAAELHEESGEIFDRVTDLAKQMGLNLVHDATMKSPKKAVALVQGFKDSGYKTEAHYMHLPRQEAAKRAVSRFLNTGRLVPPEIVLSNTENEKSFNEVKGLTDRWSFMDNNVPRGEPPKLISSSDH